MKKLYVGNLPYSVTEDQLEEMFAKFGTVKSVDVIIDKFTNRSKGFAFVEMEEDNDANEAIKNLNDKELDGRKMIVNEAKPREENRSFGNNRPNSRFQGNSRRNDRNKRY